MGLSMSEYWLLTVWHIEAPQDAVYAAVCDPKLWPEWWPDARRIELRHAGAADGVGCVFHCVWQGRLPYRLDFDLRTTRMQAPAVVEGEVGGDLAGFGRCELSQAGAITTVRHEWRVRTTQLWMNLLSPCIRRLFKYNHALAMQHGGAGLARRLGVPLLALEHTDLGAASVRRGDMLVAAVCAGLVAGAIATVAQLLLWWLAALPVAETLWRDVRLTAAIVMGPAVLLPPGLPSWPLLLLATSIHCALSGVYGLMLARLIDRLPTGRALLAGGLFGMALYGVNLYGFTAVFPWFAVARDGITVAAHLVFGVALAGCYRAWRPR